jgi:transcriptional regulator with XRE-family HTH domain
MVPLPRLKSIRLRKALTQRELAERADLSQATIVTLETGQAEARPSTVRKLADALGVEPQALMEPEA